MMFHRTVISAVLFQTVWWQRGRRNSYTDSEFAIRKTGSSFLGIHSCMTLHGTSRQKKACQNN